MKSGILAAEAVYQQLQKDQALKPGIEIKSYQEKVEKSWIWEEMYQTRSIKGGFKYSLLLGLPHSLLISKTKGREF